MIYCPQHRDSTSRRGLPAFSLLSLLASLSCSSGAELQAASGGSTNASTATGGGATTQDQVGSGGAVSGGAGVGTGGAGAGGEQTGSGSTASGGASVDGAGGGAIGTSDVVTRTASTYSFQHFPIEAGTNNVWNGPATPGTQAITTVYNTTILENGYLKVTLLPDYGGRILSILHKPTGRELLYQNPIGTPYLMGEDIFYYDYLVIMGGIFPSFPEPEHGKYWNLPYQFEVVSETAEAITVRMSRKDDADLVAGVPARYDVGRTDVLVELEVTLRAGSSRLDLETKLTNTKDSPVAGFEYWTVTTLAPGSTPGATAIPLKTRIMAKMDQVHLLESSWSWFGTAETRVSGEIFKWDQLSHFENWIDQGTAFASPNYSANWSGLINDENGMGILRVSDTTSTPGLKLWTFGKDSLSIDINDSSQWLRPTIEMWHGVTPEFWNRGTMAVGEVRKWTDNYFPTLGLKEITSASAFGALYLATTTSGTNTELSATATLTVPDQTVHAILRLGDKVISEQDVVVASKDATAVSVSVSSTEIVANAVFEAEFLQGDSSLLKGQITLE